MRNIRHLSIIIIILHFMLGCSSTEPSAQSKTLDHEIPKTRTTTYDNYLHEFGKMYRMFYGKNIKIYIQSKPIENVTGGGGLPGDLSQMIITAVNKIGKPIYYVPFDPRYIALEVETGGSLSRNLPKYVIAGGITEYDKNIQSTGSGLNADASGITEGNEFDSSANMNANNSLSRLSLDLHLLDYQNQTMVPGTQSINTIEIKNSSKKSSFNFFIFGSGIGYNGQVSSKQGVHAALRILVESSVLQLLAREAGLPYWKITDGKVDHYVIEKVVDDLSPFSKGRLLKIIQVYLNTYGFKIHATGKMDDITDLALKQLSKDLKFEYKGVITPELTKDIWINRPYLPTDKHYTNSDLKKNLITPKTVAKKLPLLKYNTAIKYCVNRIRDKAGSDKFQFISMIDTHTQSRTAKGDNIRLDIITQLNDNNKNYGQFVDANSRTLVKKVKKQSPRKNTIQSYLTEEKKGISLNFILSKEKKVIDQFKILYTVDYKKDKTQAIALTKTAGIDSEMKNDVVMLTTEKGDNDPIFYSGEPIHFKLTVTQPLYVHIINIDSSNHISELYDSKERLIPNKEYIIPDENETWDIVAQAPFGREAVKAFASDRYIDFDTLIKEKVKNKTRTLIKKLEVMLKIKIFTIMRKDFYLKPKNNKALILSFLIPLLFPTLHAGIVNANNEVLEDSAIVESLMHNNDFDVNRQNTLGETYLHVAAKRGDKILINKLIKKYADMNRLDHLHHTALHNAILYKNYEIAKTLIQAGADITIIDQKGNTALMLYLNQIQKSNLSQNIDTDLKMLLIIN